MKTLAIFLSLLFTVGCISSSGNITDDEFQTLQGDVYITTKISAALYFRDKPEKVQYFYNEIKKMKDNNIAPTTEALRMLIKDQGPEVVIVFGSVLDLVKLHFGENFMNINNNSKLDAIVGKIFDGIYDISVLYI